MSADPYSTTRLEQPAPATVRRSGPTWPAFAVALVVVVALGAAGFAVLYRELQALQEQTALLEAAALANQESIGQTAGSVADLEGSLATTQEELNSLGISVTDIDKGLQEQADRSLDTVGLSQAVLPSVVTVVCGPSLGSGFAITVNDLPSGEGSAILTNHHVIVGCAEGFETELSVQQGEQTFTTRLGGWDAANDLALLYVQEQFPPLAVGGTPDIGEPVMALGSPYGFDGTVTVGTITNIQPDYFTHSAALGSGNSGGPLVDRDGRAIGVNTAEIEGSEGQNIAMRIRVACQELIDCA